MATNPLGGESATVTSSNTFPPAAAGHIAAKLLNRHSPHEIAEAIEVLVDVLDCIGGDPDAEDATDLEDDHSLSPQALQYAEPGPGCSVADQDAGAYVEWASKPGNRRRDGNETIAGREDDETDSAEDDFHPRGGSFALGRGWTAGPGCPISDPDSAVDDTPCDDINMDLEEENDAEREQMPHDVPMLSVVSYEHNPFTDQRVSLGISNLMDSFVCKEVVSADTGVLHRHQRANGWPKPGTPV